MSFAVSVAGNVVANVVFWLLLGFLFWSVTRFVERRLVRFLGLSTRREMIVYLSNLWPADAGEKPGSVISLHEFRAAQSINSLLGAAPLRLPELVRGLVDAVWLRRPVRYSIEVSPADASEANVYENLIVVGGRPRNSIRRHFLENGLPRGVLANEVDGTDQSPPVAVGGTARVIIRRSGYEDQAIEAAMNVAVVEKARDTDHGTTVFFCAGVRADSSWAATEYLVRHWKALEREFGDGCFVVCLGFPWTHRHLEGYREPLRLNAFRT